MMKRAAMKDTDTPKSKESASNSRLERMAWALVIAFVVFMAIAIIQALAKANSPVEPNGVRPSSGAAMW